jgi:hypothetical protein
MNLDIDNAEHLAAARNILIDLSEEYNGGNGFERYSGRTSRHEVGRDIPWGACSMDSAYSSFTRSR